jgi:pimeloyl-ACP methyl ester carboxylesterase
LYVVPASASSAMVLSELTVVFLHGAGGSRMTWHLQLPHFKDALAIDLPGHPIGSGFSTILQYVDWIQQCVRDNKVRNPVIVGHSMGGAIGIEFALRNSDLTGLVLVGTGARLRVHPSILSKTSENYEEACRLIANWSVSPRGDPVIKDRIAQEMLKVRADVTYGDFLACDNFDRMSDVERIHCPTLIVCGADDELTPVKYSRYLHEKIRGSKLLVIEGAGHMVMLEKHRAFNDALETFLATLPASESEA